MEKQKLKTLEERERNKLQNTFESTPEYKQDFSSKKAVFIADAQTELIAKMLKELDK